MTKFFAIIMLLINDFFKKMMPHKLLSIMIE